MSDSEEEKSGILKHLSNEKAMLAAKVLEGYVAATDLSGHYSNAKELNQSLQTSAEQQVEVRNPSEGGMSQEELNQKKIDGIQGQIETAGDFHNSKKEADNQKAIKDDIEAKNFESQQTEQHENPTNSYTTATYSAEASFGNTAESPSKIQAHIADEQAASPQQDTGQDLSNDNNRTPANDNTPQQDDGQKR